LFWWTGRGFGWLFFESLVLGFFSLCFFLFSGGFPPVGGNGFSLGCLPGGGLRMAFFVVLEGFRVLRGGCLVAAFVWMRDAGKRRFFPVVL